MVWSCFLACLVLLPAPVWGAAAQNPEENGDFGAAKARKVQSALPKRWITADHSQHEALQGNFTSGPEVTKACLSCHNEASKQMQKTIHWSWICPHDPNKEMGKYGITLNNFCIAVPTNEPRCTSCHTGYGWRDKNFMQTATENDVDCLVCHEQTETYKKFPTMAGNVVSEPTPFDGETYLPPDWNKVAQSVGRPSRVNCGGCHFNGGGGDAVKHGDLDTTLYTPDKQLDVHMNAEGANFDCVRCHTTEAHAVAGRCYKHPATMTPEKSLIQDDQIKRIACASCHTIKPHKPGHKANDHTDVVACQSCHIPEFARGQPTKMWWDWSMAGDKERQPNKNEFGNVDYDAKKGEFRWEKDVVPEYHWFNGVMNYTLLTDTIDPDDVVRLNYPVGERGDLNSRIYPFKAHRGMTPYDKGNKTMAIPHLFPRGKDDTTAYWKNFDWTKSLQFGMEYVDMPFSGEAGFVETVYYYPTTHMVAPKENTLACADCHSRQGRLATLAGFYMPGRDNYTYLDIFGWLLVIGSLVGVTGHGLLRIVSRPKKG